MHLTKKHQNSFRMFLCSAVQALYAIQFVFAAEASSRCVKRALQSWEKPVKALGQKEPISQALSNLDNARNQRYEMTMLAPRKFIENPDGSLSILDQAMNVGREVNNRKSVFSGGSSHWHSDSQWGTKATREERIHPNNFQRLIDQGLPSDIRRQLENKMRDQITGKSAGMLMLPSGSVDAPTTAMGANQLRIEDVTEDNSDYLRASPRKPSYHSFKVLKDSNPETPRSELSESSTKHEEKEGDGVVGPPAGQEYIVKEGKSGSVTSEVSTPEKKVPSESQDTDPRIPFETTTYLTRSEFIWAKEFQFLAQRRMGFNSEALAAFEKEKGLSFSSINEAYYPKIIIRQALRWLIEHDHENELANMILHQEFDEIVAKLIVDFQHLTWEESLLLKHPQVTPTEAKSFLNFARNSLGEKSQDISNTLVDTKTFENTYQEWNKSEKGVMFHLMNFWHKLSRKFLGLFQKKKTM